MVMSIKKSRETIALDFDGVLHDYKEWDGIRPKGPPVEGAVDFVLWLKRKGFSLYILSVRAGHKDGVQFITKWLEKWGFPKMDVTDRKQGGCLMIDDRGFRFEGDFEVVRKFILENPSPGRWGLKDDSEK